MRSVRLVLPALLLTLAACTTVAPSDGADVSGGNAIATAHLRHMVDEMRYMHGQELLQRMSQLASLRDDAVPAVTDGVSSDDWLVRSSCLWVLGAMGDRRNIPAIHSALGDRVPEVRYQAASTLVKLGDQRGFPELVRGLGDGDLQNRYKCFQTLRLVTGKDFGYRHDAAPEDRREALVRWNDWLASVGSSAL